MGGIEMRKNEIQIGERVFDVVQMRAAKVIDIHKDKEDKPVYTLQADDQWNRTYMDLDTEQDEIQWEPEADSDIYQFVPDRVDHRNGYPVCYEHTDLKTVYPYYCPVLDENLFEFETEKTESR